MKFASKLKYQASVAAKRLKPEMEKAQVKATKFLNNNKILRTASAEDLATSSTDGHDTHDPVEQRLEADKGEQKITNDTSFTEDLAANRDEASKDTSQEEQQNIAYEKVSDDDDQPIYYQQDYGTSETYELEKYRHNAMVIFNHYGFHDSIYKRQIGSKDDEERLMVTFGRYGFESETFIDLNADDLLQTLKEFCLRDFTDYGCVCAVVMTCGDEDGRLRAWDRYYREQDFIGMFSAINNPTLYGKPIIILIQASRGNAVAVKEHPKKVSRSRIELDGNNYDYASLGSDMLIFHSCNVGQMSFRNVYGSWFIQSLCTQIDLLAENEDFESICRAVKKKVSDHESNIWVEEGTIIGKQMPVVTSSLLKLLYLRKYTGSDQIVNGTPKRATMHRREINDNFTNEVTKGNSSCAPNIKAPTYELEKYARNEMIVFNHENFLDDKRRKGTKIDEITLRETFQKFRFEVTAHEDLSKRELFKELRKFSKQNFATCGCICVAILTHGSDHGYLRAFDEWYSEREVFACFNALANPTLAAKPIIFLIQACRGAYLAHPVAIPQSREKRPEIELDSSRRKDEKDFLPTESDLLILHSSFFGRASARVSDKGTWFIQTLCQQITLHANEHLEKVCRRVRKTVALEKECNEGKQVPVTASTLLRKLFFIRN